MSALAGVALASVSIWLLMTLAYQYKPLGRQMARYDVLRLLPSWMLFAPNPATRDCHLVVRDQFSDDTLGDWEEVDIAPARTSIDPVWHPAKRRRKILSDASQSIKRLRRETSMPALQHSLPYLMILHYCVRCHDVSHGARARQFAFVETSGRVERGIIVSFISELHPL